MWFTDKRTATINSLAKIAEALKKSVLELQSLAVILAAVKPAKTHIVIHHSATEDGRTFSWPAIRTYHTSYRYQGTIITEATAQEYIRQEKKVEKPWADIGYHFGIEKYEDTWIWMGGRMINEQGAHCPEGDMNSKGIGICFVGNYDVWEPPREMMAVGVRLITALCEFGGIDPEGIQGHNFYNPHKSCPGTKFKIDALREAVKEKCRQK